MAEDTSARQLKRAQLTTPNMPLKIRVIVVPDVKDALIKGMADFQALPTYRLFLGIIYTVICVISVLQSHRYGMLQLAYPIVAGFALLSPIVAVGFLELSRRREQGLSLAWRHVFLGDRPRVMGSVLTLSVVLLMWFGLWLGTAQILYQEVLGDPPLGPKQLLLEVFTTSRGWILILFGNGVGAIFALVAFMMTVTSLPLIIDREINLISAIRISIKVVLINPRPMLGFGLIAAGGLVLGAIPVFLGLAIILPILGHATWHLYRRVITVPPG